MREAGESMADIAIGFGLSSRRQIYGILDSERYWLGTAKGRNVHRMMPLIETLNDMSTTLMPTLIYHSPALNHIYRGGGQINARGHDMRVVNGPG